MNLKSITFAGHAAVILDVNGKKIAIDPWLMGNPICPDALKKTAQLDLICLTHGHGDHAGDVVEMHKRTNAPIVATWDLCTALVESGIKEDKVQRLNLGGEAMAKGLTVKVGLTLAYHSSNFVRPDGVKVVAGDAAGVVVKDDTFSLYHAGDTALFSDMALIGKRHRPTIGFFPIGDCVTMGPVEAAEAAKLVGVKVAIPIHFGTFPILTGEPSIFVEECGKFGIRAVVMKPGEVISGDQLGKLLN